MMQECQYNDARVPMQRCRSVNAVMPEYQCSDAGVSVQWRRSVNAVVHVRVSVQKRRRAGAGQTGGIWNRMWAGVLELQCDTRVPV